MTGRVQGWMVGGILAVVAALAFAGCQSANQSMGVGSEIPPTPAPNYYDFPDVLIPVELSLDESESLVYEYGPNKMGLLRFKGRVRVDSLVDFFNDYMPKDGWTDVNKVKYSMVLLNFIKQDRICQIIIKEKTFTTVVDVWVNPLKPM